MVIGTNEKQILRLLRGAPGGRWEEWGTVRDLVGSGASGDFGGCRALQGAVTTVAAIILVIPTIPSILILKSLVLTSPQS
jgi:hypothetical protein